MKITYDPAKRDATLISRGLDFADAVEVFAGSTLPMIGSTTAKSGSSLPGTCEAGW